jgi:hypothetical protein
MDGKLQLGPDGHYRGTLNGWNVEVYRADGQWWAMAWTKEPQLSVGAWLSGISVRDAAAKVRAWIEENGGQAVIP